VTDTTKPPAEAGGSSQHGLAVERLIGHRVHLGSVLNRFGEPVQDSGGH
jgi:hypothetical protein